MDTMLERAIRMHRSAGYLALMAWIVTPGPHGQRFLRAAKREYTQAARILRIYKRV
jgi:hypothetical protein